MSQVDTSQDRDLGPDDVDENVTSAEESDSSESESPDIEASDDSSHEEESAETRARRMGWTPKDEFRGDPSRWQPAEKFVERAEQEMPLLRAQLRRFEQQMGQYEQDLKRLAEYSTKAEQRALEKARKELAARQRAAVESGDVDAFDAASRELDELQSSASETVQDQGRRDQPPEFREYHMRAQRFAQEHPDFEQVAGNPALPITASMAEVIAESDHGPAMAYYLGKNPDRADQIARLGRTGQVRELLKIEQQVSRPTTNPERQRASGVESAGSGRRPSAGRQKTFDAIPDADRKQALRMSRGLEGAALKTFKEQYAKAYFEG